MKEQSYVIYKVIDGKVKYLFGEEEVHTKGFVDSSMDIIKERGFTVEPAKEFFHKLLEARLAAAKKHYREWFH